MNDLTQSLITKALNNLGLTNFGILGEPTNEDEFYNFIQIVDSVDLSGANTYKTRENFSITYAEFVSEYSKVKEIYDNENYKRQRINEYPSLQEQLDMQYWDSLNGTTIWQDTINQIKAKYPKSN
jgi:hypothetical protein